MKEIQIVGAGCARCDQLARNAEEAARELDIEYQLQKVTDYNTMAEMGIMMTPALVIDGELKATGKVLGVEQIKGLLV